MFCVLIHSLRAKSLSRVSGAEVPDNDVQASDFGSWALGRGRVPQSQVLPTCLSQCGTWALAAGQRTKVSVVPRWIPWVRAQQKGDLHLNETCSKKQVFGDRMGNAGVLFLLRGQISLCTQAGWETVFPIPSVWNEASGFLQQKGFQNTLSHYPKTED